jgi:ribokinase
MNKQGVLVVGSSNLDLVVTTNRFPKPGETIFGKKFEMYPGGKGANQAVCAARLGCKTFFIGKMGNDEFHEKLSVILENAGVDISNLFIDKNEHTGTALITVDETGQNQIVVISGSNMKLSSQDISSKSDLFSKTAVVLTQLEIPIETVVESAKLAHENNALFILNPAPAASLPEYLFHLIDYITPNENELELLSGLKINDDSSIRLAAEKLLKKGIRNVIVTLGDRGSMLINSSTTKHFPVSKVEVVDSTGAGDAFNGALASSLSEGNAIEKAIELANKVASISVTRMGAQSSLPYASEIKDFITI